LFLDQRPGRDWTLPKMAIFMTFYLILFLGTTP
jgi:hypothetical protein